MPDSETISLVEHLGRPLVKVNKQLYSNNPVAQQLMEEFKLSEHAPHNPKPPNLVIERERPEHTLVLLFKLKGMSNDEIAERMGYSDAWVSQLTRQPWFQQRLCDMLGEAKEEVLDELVKVEAKNSFFTLVHLRDHARSEQVRATCAMDIINRHMGKPTQRTEVHTTANVLHVTAKMEDLDRQLQEVEQEEERLLRRGTTVAEHE